MICLNRIKIFFFVMLLLSSGLLIACSETPKCGSNADDILKAMRHYKNHEPEAAKKLLSNLGDTAVSCLEYHLYSCKGWETYAANALTDIGTERAFSVLVDAFHDKSCLGLSGAAVYIRIFITTHDWTPEKLRSFPGVLSGTITYLKTARSQEAIRTAMTVRLPELVPLLREFLNDKDVEIRSAASKAIKEITGEEIDGKTITASFSKVLIDPQLLKLRLLIDLSEIKLRSAQLCANATDEPQIILATQKKDGTQFISIQMNEDTQDVFFVPGRLLGRFLILQNSERGQAWLIGAFEEYRDSELETCLIAFDHSGNIIWKYILDSQRVSSLSWQYGNNGLPILVLVALRHPGGYTLQGIDLHGNEKWRSPVSQIATYQTESCFPDIMTATWAGMGNGYLLDKRGNTLAESLVAGGRPTLRSTRIVAAGDLSFFIAASQRIAELAPQIALYDEQCHPIWTHLVPDRPRHLTAVYDKCGARGMILYVSNVNELWLVDLDGVLRWSGIAFPAQEAEHYVSGVDTWLQVDDDARMWILVYGENVLALWEHQVR